MADNENVPSDWTERIDRLLGSSLNEQMRGALEGIRDALVDLSARAAAPPPPADDGSAAVASALERVRGDVDEVRDSIRALGGRLDAVDGLRGDLVRSLEALSAAVREGNDAGSNLDEIVGQQSERILGGFAQRVGQLQGLIHEVREGLTERIDALERSAATPVEVPPVDIAAIAERVRDVLREDLQSLDVGLRTEIDATARQREDGDAKQVDALGLRITNMSMSVQQALDAVRAQVESMTDRAARVEAEQGAILEAVRREVGGIGDTVDERIAARVSTIDDKLGALARATEQLSSLDQLDSLQKLDQLDRLGSLGAIEERLTALDGLHGAIDGLRTAVDAAAEGAAERDREASARIEQALQPLASLDERMAAAVRDATGGLQGIEERMGAAVRDATGGLQGIEERMGAAVRDATAPLHDLDERTTRAIAEVTEPLGEIGARVRELADLGIPLGALPQIESQLQQVEASVAGLPALAERLDVLTEIGEKVDAVGALAVAYERIKDDIAVLPSIREQVRALVDATPLDPAEAIERVHERVGAVDDKLVALGRLDQLANALDGIAQRMASLPDVEAIAGPVGEQVGAAVTAAGERLDAIAATIGERDDALRDALASVGDMREELRGVLEAARAGEAALTETRSHLDGSETRISDELGKVVTRLSVRLDGVESAVARTVIEIRDTLTEVSQGSASAVDRLREQLEATHGHLSALDDATGSVRAHLASLPGPREVSEVVSRDVADALTGFRAATEGRVTSIERDLSAVSTNINEIWIRVRDLVSGLDEVGAGIMQRMTEQGRITHERAELSDARLERVLGGEERLRRRIADVESKLVAAARAIESERDRLFLQGFDEVIERIGRHDRKLGKRLRSLVGRKKDEGRGGSDDDPRAGRPSEQVVLSQPTSASDDGSVGPEPEAVARRSTPAATNRKPAATTRKAAARAPKKATARKKTAKRTADGPEKKRSEKKIPAKKTTSAKRSTAKRKAKRTTKKASAAHASEQPQSTADERENKRSDTSQPASRASDADANFVERIERAMSGERPPEDRG